MEGLVLLAVAVSPWALGAAEPAGEFALFLVVAALAVLWSLRVFLDGVFSWQPSAVVYCLAGLFLLTIVQTAELPPGVLASVSPATARLYEQVLPGQREILAGGPEQATTSAGRTLSLYPATTHLEGLRLIAVLLLFTSVLNNVASAGSLRRLALVCLLNGVLLSVFAVVQMFSSPRHTVYWMWDAPNIAFGPFICRNHFPFYVNICFGLGLGVLLGVSGLAAGWRRTVQDFLHHPLAPWAAASLVLCALGTLFSLSRGGFFALLGALVVLVLCRFTQGRRSFMNASAAAALFLLVLVAAGCWLGYGEVVQRLGTVWDDKIVEESRLAVWQRGLTNVPSFPLLGTGFGTFQYAELMSRTDAAGGELVYANAHNEYVEALVEGGIVRLVLSLLAIALLWRAGLRALRGPAEPERAALVWGALFALTTVWLHSFVEFGLHLPAIAFLVTVVAAQVCGLGAAAPPLRLGGAAAWSAGLVLLVLALIVGGSARSTWSARRLWEAAREMGGSNGNANLDEQLVHLDAAARLRPEFAHMQLQRAWVHTRRYDDSLKAVRAASSLDDALDAARLLADAAAQPVALCLAGVELRDALRQDADRAHEEAARGEWLVPALAIYIQCRDACPLLEEPHRMIARYRHLLRAGDAPEVYFARAKAVAPGLPRVWYECGRAELATAPAQALASWRRCLELSDEYLAPILEEATAHFSRGVIGARLLPDNARVLGGAARLLFAEEGDPQRQQLLERALQALERQPVPLTLADCRLRVELCAALGRAPAAIAACQAALERWPEHVELRLELANLLIEANRLDEARHLVRSVLIVQPRHHVAGTLLQKIVDSRARGTGS